MDKELLKGIKIIDLSHRLPGPLCGKILADLGADVIKIEDNEFKDPFLTGLFAQFDPSFVNWYEELNGNKKILRFNFNSHDDIQTIHQLIKNSDAIIMGLPPKTRAKMKLEDNDLKLQKPFVMIELLASEENNKSMHDLNALAEAGLLNLHILDQKAEIINPPMLPISGITFGHKGATDLIAGILKSRIENKSIFIKTFLDETTKEVLGIFWPEKDRALNRNAFLHNGMYPCYNIYQTKEGKYVALAAVEEKYWKRFCELFKINNQLNRFRCDDDLVFKEVSNSIKKYSFSEIEEIINHEDICLSLIK